MNYVIPLEKIRATDRARVGEKCYRLAKLARKDFRLPKTLVITTDAYDAFVLQNGLKERILMALHRKDFQDMRWEEIWDTSLRIRNMFLSAPVQKGLRQALALSFKKTFSGGPIVVRSSSPDEDTRQRSFAGLHESYVNVQGLDCVLDKVRMVWASLWSDAAILYRQEIGLDVETSTMAVILQDMVVGETSGVFFSHHPNNKMHAVMEAVYGLNQGLVDGTIEPDRWVLNRSNGRILSHVPAKRHMSIMPTEKGVRETPLSERQAKEPPLTDTAVQAIYKMAMAVVKEMAQPQDIEWTILGGRLTVLQARPITTQAQNDSDDKRSWYLSLHRSFDNLKTLRAKIETVLLPEMERVASEFEAVDLHRLDDTALLSEIERRQQTNDHWVQVYWKDFIPFAHGIRLFGQVYNDTVRPDDPYEFMLLLENTHLKSVSRNEQLLSLARLVRNDKSLESMLLDGDIPNNTAFYSQLRAFIDQFGDLSCPVTGGVECLQGEQGIITIVLEMAKHAPRATVQKPEAQRDTLRHQFFLKCKEKHIDEAKEILEMGRVSYRLRDDDNIYLGRIEACLFDALHEARLRLGNNDLRNDSAAGKKLKAIVQSTLPQSGDQVLRTPLTSTGDYRAKVRQIVGQPAGPGIARGSARVIVTHNDLFACRHGDILICDAVDPNMTFVIPLVKAVVERRGGMLIHGAIIAREYGIPCVTGITDATKIFQNGDEVTVDGYLGIVTIDDSPA